jgi:CheY-like chemotaxis protein
MGQRIENRITTVLIVEDEPLIRMSAVDFVEEAGFEAIEASGADEAIAILEQRPDIHIVFTDIHMAGSMDGLQLVAYAKDRWPPLRFIVVFRRAESHAPGVAGRILLLLQALRHSHHRQGIAQPGRLNHADRRRTKTTPDICT